VPSFYLGRYFEAHSNETEIPTIPCKLIWQLKLCSGLAKCNPLGRSVTKDTKILFLYPDITYQYIMACMLTASIEQSAERAIGSERLCKHVRY
jgi:hypothetical protein